MKHMIVKYCVLGMVSTNCYFLMNDQTKEVIIVDPADAPQKIEQMIMSMEATPVGILLTHGHYDHIMAVEDVKERYHIPVYACEEEAALLKDPQLNLSGHGKESCSVVPNVLLTDNQQFTLAGFDVRMLHTPGHTQGSCCYYFPQEDLLISGDTLFCQSVGRTDLPTGSTQEIIKSLHRLLEELPDETDVLPGHESTTSIAHEKRYNPFV